MWSWGIRNFKNIPQYVHGMYSWFIIFSHNWYSGDSFIKKFQKLRTIQIPHMLSSGTISRDDKGLTFWTLSITTCPPVTQTVLCGNTLHCQALRWLDYTSGSRCWERSSSNIFHCDHLNLGVKMTARMAFRIYTIWPHLKPFS